MTAVWRREMNHEIQAEQVSHSLMRFGGVLNSWNDGDTVFITIEGNSQLADMLRKCDWHYVAQGE